MISKTIHFFSSTSVFVTEFACMVGYAFYHGYLAATDVISQSSWDRLTGEHGLIFALSIGALTLWVTMQTKELREDRRKEQNQIREDKRQAVIDEKNDKRHDEQIKMQTDFNEKLMEIMIKNAEVQSETAQSINDMTSAINSLKEGLSVRPCMLSLDAQIKTKLAANEKLNDNMKKMSAAIKTKGKETKDEHIK